MSAIKSRKNKVIDTEVWKNIPPFGEKYKISSVGRVTQIKNGIRKNVFHKDGYVQVKLNVGGGNPGKMLLIHRLVAIAFISNPKNKPQVNHKNGIKGKEK